MGTNSNTKDDIIDLTEIVEEGFPSRTQTSDLASEVTIDPKGPAKSLDQELDDLLQEEEPFIPHVEPLTLIDEQPVELLDVSPQEETAPVVEQVVDLTDVSPQVEVPAAPEPAPELDYLDDILTSLQPTSMPEADTSLDLLLEGDIQLDFPVDPSGVEPVAPELKQEGEPLLLDDSEATSEPEASVAAPQIEPTPEPVPEKESFDISFEDLDHPRLDSTPTGTSMPVDLTDDLLPEVQIMETEQTSKLQASDKDAPVKEAATDDLEVIGARLDVLEGWAAGSECAVLDRAQVLAALPDTPDEIPFAAALRANILEEAGRLAEEKLESASVAPQLEALRQTVDALSSRLASVEGRGAEPARVEANQVLAALPDTPDEIPFAAALQANILEEAGRLAEEKFEAVSVAPQLDALRQTVDALSSRLASVEGRGAEPARVEADQVLAALPDTPDEIPFAAALRANILEEVGRLAEEKLEAASVAPQLEILRQAVDALSSRLANVEGRTAEPARVEAGQILAALPDNPEEVPYAAALRADILEEVNERMATSFVGVDELHQTVDALQDKMGTLSDSQDRLASTQNTTLVQELGTELHALREIVLRQENTVLDLQEKLEAREQEIASLRESEAALRNQVFEAERAQEESRDSLKVDLQNFIQDQVPGAAARIIREEIQKLLQNMDA